MRLRDLLSPAQSLLPRPFAHELAPDKQFELATGTVLTAVKERTDAEMAEPGRSRGWARILKDWLWRLRRSR